MAQLATVLSEATQLCAAAETELGALLLLKEKLIKANELVEESEKLLVNRHSTPNVKKPMSADVVDSNPYSRLMALQRMGVVNDYQVCAINVCD
jgi:hypothetical protein